MTQSNPPGEIKCPHCGQTYAIQPQQWPQYAGRSIACTKCGQQFAVGGSPTQAPSLPPPLIQGQPGMPPMGAGYPGYPQQPGYGYAPPPKKGMSAGAIVAIVIGVMCVLIIPCLISILLPALHKVREEALKAKCASNMKNIAATMITYSNSNNGEYPDSMSTLIRSSGMSPAILICPDSNDTPLLSNSPVTSDAALVGHSSYIYVAAGLNSNAPSNAVLVYESLSDHHGKGINVLYGDYHVSWMPASQAQLMIQSLPPLPVPGRHRPHVTSDSESQ